MKILKTVFGLAVVLMMTSACHRVKCPSDTFSKADIEAQNQPAEEAEL